MRIINTKVHGIIDYLLGLLLLTAPWTFHFREITAASFVIVSIGLLTMILAAITRFESGFVKLIGLKLHLSSDFILGLFLAASPWLLNFDDKIFKPHLVFGLGLIFVALLTDRILYSKLSHDLQ